MTREPDTMSDALLLTPETRVTCPKCEHEFSLADGFAKKSLEALEAQSHGALAKLAAEARAAEERRARERAGQQQALMQGQLKDMQALLEAQQKQHAEAVAKARALEKQAAEQRTRELEDAMKAKLETQAKQLEQFRNAEMQLRKERAELEAKQAELEIEVQRKLDEERKAIAEAARVAEAEKSKLKEADLQKKLDDMRVQVEEMKRRAEQGSQQSQGEVLELLLEVQVGQAFPLDVIEEVKKGARGGDVIQRVMTRSGQQAGLILWEAKRAQNWSPAWPAKLKADMREIGAELGVIVATSLPKEFEDGQHFGPHEDIWVTTPAMALQVAGLLRHMIENVHKQRVISANRGEKAEALYDYLTSPQFAQKWKAVYGVFQGMKKELDTERTVTTQRWNRREKQIGQAVLTLAGVAGDIQGLAQQDLPQLELDEDVEALEGPTPDTD